MKSAHLHNIEQANVDHLVWMYNRHNDLPHGKDLHREQLWNTLTQLFDEYSTDTVVSKLAPCENFQRNESLNSVIGTKDPKTRQ